MNLQSVIHLAPAGLLDQVSTYGLLAAVAILIALNAIVLVPELIAYARTWLPRTSMPPTPTYRIRIPRAWYRRVTGWSAPLPVDNVIDIETRRRQLRALAVCGDSTRVSQ